MNSGIVSLKTVDVSHKVSKSFLVDVYDVVKHAESFYPSFRSWFWDIVVPQLNSGQRSILVEERDSRVVGVAIIKNTGVEKKLCNLTVIPEYKNKGVGLKLFQRSFAELNSSKPFLTVSEDMFLEFQRIFDHYDFKVTNVEEGVYRPGKLEYFLNEPTSSLN